MILTNNKYPGLTKYATLLIILFGVCYMPLEGRGGFGIIKLCCLISAVFVLITQAFYPTKALIIGTIYIVYQFAVASMHPESFRSSTLFFSAGLVYTYVCFYNLLYVKQVFSIHFFLKLVKGIMMAFFITCIIQQCFLAVGISYFPAINLVQYLDRGIGCNSLSMEPSTFARTMLVFYYAYVKCNEYLRGDDKRFTIKELLSGEHKWVTIRFLWMMCTMGSGTAFVCLIAFSLYFVNKRNWFFIVPAFLTIYFYVLPMFDAEQLNRATSTINATSTLDQETVEEADGSAASRISPMLNSLTADYSDWDTWFGHGIDYTRNNNFVVLQKATLFDDYGFIFFVIGLIFNLTCAYRLKSLGAIFMIMGVAGGAGTNIHYTWWLMMVMTCVRYFYEYRDELYTDNDVMETSQYYPVLHNTNIHDCK